MKYTVDLFKLLEQNLCSWNCDAGETLFLRELLSVYAYSELQFLEDRDHVLFPGPHIVSGAE